MAEVASCPPFWRSDIFNVNFLLARAVGIVGVAVVTVLVEFEANTLVALVAVRVGLVNLCVLGQLAIGF